MPATSYLAVMDAASVKQLKDELSNRSPVQLKELVLQMAKFKKENKELLTYLLFEADDENSFIKTVKDEIDLGFEQINSASYYQAKKSVRKVLRIAKKHIRYSKKKQTEVEVLLHYCRRLGEMKPSIDRYKMLRDIYDKQLEMAAKAMQKLHEDLQYDYQTELDELLERERREFY